MNRYDGRTGRVERVPDNEALFFATPAVTVDGLGEAYRKPSSQSGILGGLGGILGGHGGLGSILGGRGGLGGILSKISRPNLEIEDLILVAVLYLLYRESGDIEFLLIAGAMLFL